MSEVRPGIESGFAELDVANETSEAREAVLQQLLEEQAALGRVATLVAAGADPDEVFTTVIVETSKLLGLPHIDLVRYEGTTGVIIAAFGDHPWPAGSRWELDGPSVMARVARTGRSTRIDDYRGLGGEVARIARDAGFESAIGAPITIEGRLWGAIIALSTAPEPISEQSELRLNRFTDLVATAVANAESQSELAASRRRIVAASDEARRKIERDLHDGVQQQLVSLMLKLDAMEAELPDADALEEQLVRIRRDVGSILEGLVEIARGSIPRSSPTAGLQRLLRLWRVARRSPSSSMRVLTIRCRTRSRWLPTTSSRRRLPTSPSTHSRPRCRSRSRPTTAH